VEAMARTGEHLDEAVPEGTAVAEDEGTVGRGAIEFLAYLATRGYPIKFDGSGDGGKLVLEFDRTQAPKVIELLLHTEALLRVRIEPEE